MNKNGLPNLVDSNWSRNLQDLKKAESIVDGLINHQGKFLGLLKNTSNKKIFGYAYQQIQKKNITDVDLLSTLKGNRLFEEMTTPKKAKSSTKKGNWWRH